MSDAVPKTLGRYELVEKLAQGGMAELYKARVVGAHGFEKPLVIKRILPQLASDPQFVEMFIDEAKITASLSHPKIVQVHELASTGDELFIVMEYVAGLDVLALVKKCKAAEEELPTELAVFIVQEVLDALDYAHRERAADGAPLGIVHRDISPANVLVSNRGDVKLVDFGIARAAQRGHHTQTGTLKGKYGYMSPEQIVGDPIDGRSDLFSVAVMLAELLMFRRLFTAPNDLDVLLMVRDVRLDRLDQHGAHIPADLRAIIERVLQRSPDDRFQRAAEFRDALGDWLFANRLRPGRAQLEEFVANLSRSQSERQRRAALQRAVIESEFPDIGTISGPTTRAKKLAAEEAARVGRALFARGDRAITEPPPDESLAEDSGVSAIAEEDIPIIFDEADGAPRTPTAPPVPEIQLPPEDPDSIGDFSKRSPFRVFHQLAAYELDGLLVVERDGSFKEAYFTNGQPMFVRSNIGSERLGEYLVAERVITRDDLSRALAVLPHFGGRLGDTLVGLELMRPLDAFRHLARQVREKLVDVCTWTTGRYRWYADKANPWPALPLHLATREIMGAGAMRLPHAFVTEWATAIADRRPARTVTTTMDLDGFGLGSRPSYVYNLLDGGSTVRELLRRFSAQDRVDFLRVLYLLSETDACHIEKS